MRGAAPTGKAAVELAAGAGLEARTVDSLLLHVQRGGTLSEEGRYRVLILDEAGMAHTRQVAQLFEIAEREGMKVIAMGDSAQLTSVSTGGWLGYFSRSGLRPVLRLSEIVRQHDPQQRKAISDLSRGRPGTWIEYQEERGNVLHLGAGQVDQYRARAAQLLADAADRHGWNHVLAITPTNMRREAINEDVQQTRLARGELGEMLAVSNEHERFHIGDRVMYVGRNDRSREVQNGLIGTALGKTEQGELVISLNDGSTQLRTLNREQVETGVRLAYAVTDYKGQGITVQEAVMVAAPDELTLNRGYVAASRAREQTKLVLIADTTKETALKDLAGHLRIREDDELAIEHINPAKEAQMTNTQNATNTTVSDAWLSEHRSRINELGDELERLAPIAFRYEFDDTRDQELQQVKRRLSALDREFYQDVGLLRRAGRKERDDRRDVERRELEQQEQRLRAETVADTQASFKAAETLDGRGKERRQLIQIAAADEFDRKIAGKHAPWVYETVGPKPPSEQQGLLQRWYRVGEHLAALRLDRGIIDPADSGLTDKDSTLASDINRLRAHIEQTRELGPGAPTVAMMESKHYSPGSLGLPIFSTRSPGSNGYGLGD